MTFNNKTYDVLKYIAQIGLPALATLYFALSAIWGLPYGQEVEGTIIAIDTCLGVLLGISTSYYNAETTTVDDAEVTEANTEEVNE